MTTTTTTTLTTPSTSSPYPFAAAPDIIRAHQKDAYFTGTLANDVAHLHRSLLGARSAHAWATESRLVSSLLYLTLTTLAGNRTLGEEYTDVVQLHAGDSSNATSPQLPSLRRRAAYIASSVLVPYFASRTLPGVRSRLRTALERRLRRLRSEGESKSFEAKTWNYVLTHLGTITSAGPLHAIALAAFYFSGTYYELSKRLLGLRYVFTRKVPESPDRAGYEVLGALLVIQLATQTYLHIRSTLSSASDTTTTASAVRERAQTHAADLDVSLSDNHYTSNNQLLAPAAPGAASYGSGGGSSVDLSEATHTPVMHGPRYTLEDEKAMAFIKGAQQRKCTLCLEMLKDPAATQCGHVFCWECIGDWVREKPECPLCRREAMVQHILPLRLL